MNEQREPRDAAPLDAALDGALRRELQPPDLPEGFRERLRAAIVRAPQLDKSPGPKGGSTGPVLHSSYLPSAAATSRRYSSMPSMTTNGSWLRSTKKHLPL